MVDTNRYHNTKAKALIFLCSHAHQCFDNARKFGHLRTANRSGLQPPSAPPRPGAGDTWTWTGIRAQSKLIVSWLVGGRDSDYAIEFMDDLRSRLANRVQLTTDGHRAYLRLLRVHSAAMSINPPPPWKLGVLVGMVRRVGWRTVENLGRTVVRFSLRFDSIVVCPLCAVVWVVSALCARVCPVPALKVLLWTGPELCARVCD